MKKPTAKQIAARKLFVKRVKAGEFRKKNPAKKTLKKKARKNPVKTPGAALNKIIPRKNPVKYKNLASGKRAGTYTKIIYSIHDVNEPPEHPIGLFPSKADAIRVAQAISDKDGKPLAVSRIHIATAALKS